MPVTTHLRSAHATLHPAMFFVMPLMTRAVLQMPDTVIIA